MDELLRTPLYDRHRGLRAHFVGFGGWEMPLQYPVGIVREHLACRRGAGLFDVSHMGRLAVRGGDALPFLQHVLTNNAAGPDVGEAQYTLIPTPSGGAVDDAYLCRFEEGEYLLVVNAANRLKDLAHLEDHQGHFGDVGLDDLTPRTAMMALQGPRSRAILESLIDAGRLPDPLRNELGEVRIGDATVRVSRSGYTGEPLCFELHTGAEEGAGLWDRLVAAGAAPAGLGARDTLRLEAGLPLYGHELGLDPGGAEIPIYATPSAKTAVSFSPRKGAYVGRQALLRQHDAFERITYRDYALRQDLPRLIQPVALLGAGVARAGDRVLRQGRHVGWITSGTRVPYWVFDGDGLEAAPTERHGLRSLCLAYLDCDLVWDDRVDVEIRGRPVEAVVVEHHLRSEAPPYARPILHGHELPSPEPPSGDRPSLVLGLMRRTADNTRWRQEQCLNLIPSEMTPSPMVRLASVMDPAFRYAEHKKVEAFYEEEVFYYQGVDFIREVERLLTEEMRRYLGCREVEVRPISGQMANAVVFSALVEYVNRADPKREPGRLRQVVNNHIIRGGHLSAQPMGALRDFVARNPRTDRPAVEELPVLADNPYRIDVPQALEVIDRYRPRLIVLGKSMVLHPEPVAELRGFVDDQNLDTLILYDMAHVLGLVGPHFQEPFAEGAHLVTGSTHKTFFGPQRGIVACDWDEHEERYELWEAVQRRTFPGSVSNHHLGTLLGCLVAAYEMNHFKDEYQPAVLGNAKAFARALAEAGLEVAGDPAVGFTQTHQVVVKVGYGRGPEVARRLERSNILCNYQATPDEEGFTAAGGLRLGVAEMTRFGMGPEAFQAAAGLLAEAVLRGRDVGTEVKALRRGFRELGYCFRGGELDAAVGELRGLV
ncbi:MAG: glycine cleavage system protein T [Deferrisomatales bacterium]